MKCLRTFVLACLSPFSTAFTTPSGTVDGQPHATTLSAERNNDAEKHYQSAKNLAASGFLAASITFSASLASPMAAAHAYDPSDYASETVQDTVRALKDTSGNIEETFKVYESIASIVTVSTICRIGIRGK